MEIQLSTADMNAVSPEGNRLGHIDVSLQQVGQTTGVIAVMTPCGSDFVFFAFLSCPSFRSFLSFLSSIGTLVCLSSWLHLYVG